MADKNTDSPIFIIGTERSGTNLLRLILNAHPNIALPHPPHIMKNFSGLTPLYHDLGVDANFRRLIGDVVRSVDLHPYPWGIRLDCARIFKEARDRNLINIFFCIYNQFLESTGKGRWGCKSTFMLHHVESVLKYYPSARFIYMARDGRDVAASAKKTIFNRYSVYYTARLWRDEQRICIRWLNELARENIMLLRYEDLLREPEGSVRAICLFIKEDYNPAMLDFFKTEEAGKSSSISDAWRNTASPIIRDNLMKYRGELTGAEIDLFEAMAGRELALLSYALKNPQYAKEGKAAFRLRYLVEEWLLMLKVQLKYLFIDRNNFLRFRKFLFIKSLKVMRRIR